MKVGWKSEKLGAVCKIIKRGIAPKYINFGGVSVINQKCIRDHMINMSLARRHDISAKPVNPERFITYGDVLVNSTGTGTLGRVAQVRSKHDELVTVDTHVTIVRPKEDLFYPDFFGYMMIKIEDEIISSGVGASGQTELPRQKLADEFAVSYPESQEEQKIIAAILDEAFAGIETAIANTEKNLANARELFESYLNSVFSEQGEKQEEVPLEKHIKFIDYRGRTPKKTASGIKLITAKNVRMGFLKREPEEFINPDAYDGWMTRGIPKKGDVLFTTEAPLGLVCQLDTGKKVAFAQRIITLQPDRKVIDPGYLAFVLRSPLLQSRIHEKATGATATGIKASLLKKIPIPLASRTEQEEIVKDLNDIETEVRRLESIYQQKLTALAELKQSLLRKAFSGELTADVAEESEEAVA